jgi:hypothetical protein
VELAQLFDNLLEERRSWQTISKARVLNKHRKDRQKGRLSHHPRRGRLSCDKSKGLYLVRLSGEGRPTRPAAESRLRRLPLRRSSVMCSSSRKRVP